MEIEVKVPSVGESVQEAILAQWYKADGDGVKKDEPLFVLETDKVTLEVNAEADGLLAIKVQEGETVSIGAVVGTIETDADAGAGADETPSAETSEEEAKQQTAPPESEETKDAAEPEKEPPKPAEGEKEAPEKKDEKPPEGKAPEKKEGMDLSPSVRRLVAQKGIDPADIEGTGPGGRITKGDVIAYLEREEPPKKGDGEAPATAEAKPTKGVAPARGTPEESEDREERKPMSPIRKRIASRLLEARRNTAMLTTFNDVDMSRAMEIRSRYKDAFKEKHEISLGFMSFFIKASVEALKEFPAINAFVEETDIVYHHYYHVGVAVGSDRGLVVPVIRNADRLSFAGVEKAIVDFVKKIKANRLELNDLEGGTFTITNGGVFGSLLSTPILNTPQSGILGMHRIEKRPVVVDDEIVVRPMMYLALSYDHRIVDGREAVTFLKRIKEYVENPERILLEV